VFGDYSLVTLSSTRRIPTGIGVVGFGFVLLDLAKFGVLVALFSKMGRREELDGSRVSLSSQLI